VTQNPLEVIQIVRNWGPVGGMEAYVWHLSQELSKRNCKVTIVCEKAHQITSNTDIRVIEIGQLKQKPRWLLYLRFAKQVDQVVQSLKSKEHLVVHSHERSISHDITTFHSMPFATIKDKGWWKLISIRAWTYLKLEKQELGGFNHQAVRIIPVSKVIAKAIQTYYPEVAGGIQSPITPGVVSMPTRPDRLTPSDGGTIGFIGKEWRRKGFQLFMKIAEQLKQQRPNLKVVVLGPEKSEVADLCKNFDGDISFKGWQPSDRFYQEFDLLIHPASSEAYGMIIAEAMSCKVPVVVSGACGAAADVSTDHGSVLSLNDSLETWVNESHRWLSHTKAARAYQRTWGQVAEDYLEQYHQINQS
jgi:UDP-glucose:(heptosyl)LPS alpha-1,3-glucosyltransferase